VLISFKEVTKKCSYIGQIIGLYYVADVSCRNSAAPVSAELIPPYSYGYQCSSALLKNYAPVLVVSFTMMLFATLCQYVLLVISNSYWTKKYNILLMYLVVVCLVIFFHLKMKMILILP
jgi:hypothetical protein